MDAWTPLEAAIAQVPEADRERCLVLAAGARARVTGDASPLGALAPLSRLQALAYFAAARPPVDAGGAAVVRAALDELAWPWPTTGLALALRFGLEPPARPDGSWLVAALQTAVGWGLDGADAIARAARQLGAEDIGTDTVRLAALEAMDAAGDEALAIARAIAFPALRMHGLFVAALAGASPDPLEAEAVRVEVALDELWPGVADAELAALTGREAPLDQAIMVLDKPTTLETRFRLWRVLFRAATRFGVQRWRLLVERLREDKALMRDGAMRGNLLWEATTSAHLLPSPEARADGLGALAEGARRLPDAGLRALVYAEMARLLATVPGSSPAIWIDEAKKILTARTGTPETHLPQTLRALATLDPNGAARLVEALPRAADRVLGFALIAEITGGARAAT
ncbi:MAG: hypothetical protein IT385_15165 [Deltaproteobacteria bacterium]|nr:hypothetical protein [Deltaproteobacteria bacterium]